MIKSAKLAVVAAVGMGLCVGSITAEARSQISINGSTTNLPILQEATEMYTERYGTNFSVAGTGSGNGIRAVIDSMTDIGMSSRWIRDSEVQQAFDNGVYVVPFAIALDGIIPVVHPDNPVKELTSEQLRGIYNGSITNWSELGGRDRRIVSISRDSSSGTYGVWVERVLKGDRVSGRTQLLASNGAIVSAVSENRDAIGYVGVGYLTGRLQPITLDGIVPTNDNIQTGDWPIARTLWVFTNNWPTGETLRFINFLLHPERGQKAVERTGYVPLY
ncbi:phosphate ABC transporter substrate-binding protein [Halorhodospira abdelmalekii]|nr:phosphate ABC transporter substrate-binding protein [Halorhodospira abdelmalekii]